jgi:hypothetical protein
MLPKNKFIAYNAEWNHNSKRNGEHHWKTGTLGMSRLRNLQVGAYYSKQAIHISKECIKNLDLKTNMIRIAHERISMNIIV